MCPDSNGSLASVVEMSARISRADVVVYDLDGVITTRDSFTALILMRLRKAPLRLVQALPAAAAMLLGRHGELRHRAARRVAEIALAGMVERDYAELALAFGNSIGGDASWIRPEAVQRIRRQHTGMVVTDHRVGARKTVALREQQVPIEEAEFVTDSMTDLPTAQVAARVVLIGASSKTRDRYARAGIKFLRSAM
jgi:phosphatidylglycerophosphatase C